jgi:preprotein translocase subunit SecA
LKESATELRKTYGLQIESIAPFAKVRRRQLPALLFLDARALDERLLQIVKRAHRKAQPVLIGVASVDESIRVSALLSASALPHELLNAGEHAKEAAIVATAGQKGRITVATNMAGRGTDILLGEGVAQAGGLLVVSCQSNGSQRIDRQLSGRSGRRGDPGSAATLLSVKRGVLARFLPSWFWDFLWIFVAKDAALPDWLGERILRLAQRFEEFGAMRQRRLMMRNDEMIEENLSFGGKKDQ